MCGIRLLCLIIALSGASSKEVLKRRGLADKWGAFWARVAYRNPVFGKCPACSEGYVLRRHVDSSDLVLGGSSRNHYACCEPRAECPRSPCAAGFALIPYAKPCRGAKCFFEECCEPAGVCNRFGIQIFDCGQGYGPLKDPGYCVAGECLHSECCERTNFVLRQFSNSYRFVGLILVVIVLVVCFAIPMLTTLIFAESINI